MFKITSGFPGYSVDDLKKAKDFYSQTLGLKVDEDTEMGLLHVTVGDKGLKVTLYAKDNHEAATYTVLNLFVDNIDETVDELISRGVTFEKYEGFGQDEKGVSRSQKPGWPTIAWFQDPAGNILSLIEGQGF